MQRLGFIHDIMDVKLLILFILSRVKYPVNLQQIYELCYQDDSLSYFDVCTAIPDMVASQHIQPVENDCYVITGKGREVGEITVNDIAFTVRERAEDAIDTFNRQTRRSKFVKAEIQERPSGDFSILMTLDDDAGSLMRMELYAPNQRQAIRLARLFEKKAESVYNLAMAELLSDEEIS